MTLPPRELPSAATGLLVAASLALVSGGCGSSAAPSASHSQARAALTVLGREYSNYLAEHNGAPPRDEAELRKYLESRRDDLSAYHVTSVEQLFQASRDGKPFAVVFGSKIASPNRAEMWAAYEREGVNGMRLASDTRGNVVELESAEFAKQFPNK